MGMTFTEKILAAHAGKSTARAGEILTIKPDFVMSHDNTGPIYNTFKKIGAEKVVHPERCVIVLDHAVPASDEKHAANHAGAREFVERFGVGLHDLDNRDLNGRLALLVPLKSAAVCSKRLEGGRKEG